MRGFRSAGRDEVQESLTSNYTNTHRVDALQQPTRFEEEIPCKDPLPA